MDNINSQNQSQYVRTPKSQTTEEMHQSVKTASHDNSDAEWCGILPSPAPLANPYVPFQRNNPQKYLPSKGIMRGTLFPGLDLPFHAMVNEGEMWGTPLAELMALDFAIKELQLYLDTHSKDKEALELMQSYIGMQREGMKKYVELYGPISIEDVEHAKSFTWLRDPWPWEYTGEDDK